jgi:hypothetical protein
MAPRYSSRPSGLCGPIGHRAPAASHVSRLKTAFVGTEARGVQAFSSMTPFGPYAGSSMFHIMVYSQDQRLASGSENDSWL